MRQFGDYGRCARARAAAHTGRHEEHPRAGRFEPAADVVERFDGRFASVFGIVARTETFAPQLHLLLDGTVVQRLCVGIADHEPDVLDAEVPHVVHGVAAGTADAHHHDYRRFIFCRSNFVHQIVTHNSLTSFSSGVRSGCRPVLRFLVHIVSASRRLARSGDSDLFVF